MRKEGKKSLSAGVAYGKYLGDFYSEPHGDVHSTVYEYGGLVHVYYSMKLEAQAETPAGSGQPDHWREEILEYLYSKGFMEDGVPISFHRR